MEEDKNIYQKEELAVAKAILRLTELGYIVLLPINTHLRYDLVINKENIFYKIQVKYTSRGECVNKTGQRIAAGWVANYYEEKDFDYYALYLPEIDTVVFPSIKFAGCTINHEPVIEHSFWWFEDFLELTDNANKRIYEEFDSEKLKEKINKKKEPRIAQRKVERPTKEELEKLIWEKPTTQIAKDFGVSDVAISKWCKIYNIEKPSRGYWTKNN